MFIQHLATTTHNVVKTERKPRRNIQYRDVSSAVAKTDNLEFAVDVVPRTVVYREARRRREEREEREEEREREREREGRRGGQRLLDGGGVLLEKGVGEGNANGATGTTTTSSPPAAKPDAAVDAMDIDERVKDSDKEEDAAAAMQLEMEMRGPPRQVKTASPEARRPTGGFTSINGAK